MSSNDDVSGLTLTFTNNENIVEAEFCAEIVLEWNNGEEFEEAASLDFNLQVEASSSDIATEEATTPETAIQVVPEEDEVEITVTVNRPNPSITLTVQNSGTLSFGEVVLIEATSPSPGYEFKLIGAESQGAAGTTTLTVVDAGPGPSGVVFKIDDFQLEDFTGSAIDVTLSIQWDVNGFSNSDGGEARRRSVRRLVPMDNFLGSTNSKSEQGEDQYQLQIHTAVPSETSSSSVAGVLMAYGLALLAVLFV
ncbi:MAG: hypothetical protein SGILL_005581 [Bacillariaceae sp.]